MQDEVHETSHRTVECVKVVVLVFGMYMKMYLKLCQIDDESSILQCRSLVVSNCSITMNFWEVNYSLCVELLHVEDLYLYFRFNLNLERYLHVERSSLLFLEDCVMLHLF